MYQTDKKLQIQRAMDVLCPCLTISMVEICQCTIVINQKEHAFVAFKAASFLDVGRVDSSSDWQKKCWDIMPFSYMIHHQNKMLSAKPKNIIEHACRQCITLLYNNIWTQIEMKIHVLKVDQSYIY